MSSVAFIFILHLNHMRIGDTFETWDFTY